jgi:hypothetical protein
MNFTFGIITDGKQFNRVEQVVASIVPQMEGGDEILVVSEEMVAHNHTKTIICDKDKRCWITRKKNLLAKCADNENLVILHDYIHFDAMWRRNWELFGDDWDYAMNVILCNGKRYRDWCAWDDPAHGYPWTCFDAWCPQGYLFEGRPCIVPYTYNRTQYTYTSGAFFLVKRQMLLDNPFDENLCWGQGEDVEWSIRVREKYKYVMNTTSCVHLLKDKDPVLPFVDL